MPRQPKRTERLELCEIDEEMRQHFIANGWDLNDKFMIDQLMRARNFLRAHPLPEWILHPKKERQETIDNSDIAT